MDYTQAVQSRQLQIEQNQIELFRLGDLDRLLAVPRFDHAIALSAKHVLQHEQTVIVIFDDQNRRTGIGSYRRAPVLFRREVTRRRVLNRSIKCARPARAAQRAAVDWILETGIHKSLEVIAAAPRRLLPLCCRNCDAFYSRRRFLMIMKTLRLVHEIVSGLLCGLKPKKVEDYATDRRHSGKERLPLRLRLYSSSCYRE